MRTVLRNRDLSILLGGRLVSSSGDWLFIVALTIAIYRYSGNNSFLVGLLWIVRLIPLLFVGPFAGALADRFGHRRSMVIADLGRMVLVAVLAATLSAHSWAVIYPLAFLITALSALFRPASVGLIPELVSSREELLPANAATMQAESIAMIFGCIAGGAIAGTGAISQLLWIEAATYGLSAFSLRFIRAARAATASDSAHEPSDLENAAHGGLRRTLRMIRERPALLFCLAIMTAPEFASGAFVVWIVPFAEHSLHLGNAGVGYLYAALGAGRLLGGSVAAAIAESVRLDTLLAASVLIGGVCLALFGIWPVALVAIAFACLIGLAEIVEYASQETLLQQSVPDSVISSTSGTMDSFFFNMALVGNAASGPIASVIGLTHATTLLGTAVVILSGASWWYFRRQVARMPDPSTLSQVQAFAQLPDAVKEWAVRRMTKEEIMPGTVVVRQGDVGDRFYAIVSGTALVDVQQGDKVNQVELRAGDTFGEIALLHDVPRTATVRAKDRLTVYSLDREDFLELRDRASEVHESLLETANARLQSDANLKLALVTGT